MYAQSTTAPLFVAIDIGKNVHCFGGYAGQDPVAIDSIQEVRSNRLGYVRFCAWLNAHLHGGQYEPIVVGLEPTSTYHEPWAYAIQADYGHRIDFRFLNPYQTKQKRKQLKNGRRRKTDPIDVAAIAYCLRDGLGQPARLPRHSAFDFSVWAAAYRRMQREQQRLRVNLIAQIDRLWPGALVNVKAFQKAHPDLPVPQPLILTNPLDRKLIQILLEHAPDPHPWRGCSLSDIQTFFRSHGLPCGPIMSQKLYNVVHEALLLPPDLTERLSQRLQGDLAYFRALRHERDRLKQEAELLVPNSPAAVLATVPGIGDFLAAQYLAYVIDAQRFDHADQIWSLAGFDPAQEESGDWRRVGKITRRGNPGLRHVLYTIGLNTSQRCPAIARAKARAQLSGKGPVGAVIHASHKANRMCYRLLRDQVAYDPGRMR
jgi:transposase